MNGIEKRLEKIEQALSDRKKIIPVVLIEYGCIGLNDMSMDRLGPIKQWETYKQAIDTDEDIIMFRPDPQKEIEVRHRLQKETKGNT